MCKWVFGLKNEKNREIATDYLLKSKIPANFYEKNNKKACFLQENGRKRVENGLELWMTRIDVFLVFRIFLRYFKIANLKIV